MDPNQLANLSPAQKEEIMQTVQQQVALANMQELLQKVTDKCFKKCITSPGSSMGSSDQKCVAMCMDRYISIIKLKVWAELCQVQIKLGLHKKKGLVLELNQVLIHDGWLACGDYIASIS